MIAYTIHVCGRCGMQLMGSGPRFDDDDAENWGHPLPVCWSEQDAPAWNEIAEGTAPPLFTVVRVTIERDDNDKLTLKEEAKL